jgi:hypothetical protein
MPFLDTAPAAGCSGVLGDKHRMVFHRRLFPVVSGILWSDAVSNKVDSMLVDGIEAFVSDIQEITLRKFKAGPERREFEGLKSIFKRVIHK